MKNIFNIIVICLCFAPSVHAQMPFQVQLVVNNSANTLTVNLRNIQGNQPTTSQNISSINMRLLGSVSSIISIASTNYTMLMPSTAEPNTQVITMGNPFLPSPENWMQNVYVPVVVYNLTPGNYTNASFSVQPDLDGDNSDVQDPIMSVAAAGVFNTSLLIESTVLPIKLESFSATPQGDAIGIDWDASLEINVDQYAILRSEDATRFESIAYIDYDRKKDGVYAYMDKDVVANRDYYYILESIDLDGTSERSPIIMARLTKAGVKLSIYPNPGSSYIYVNTNSINTSDIQIYDSKGSSVLNRIKISESGLNKYYIDIAELPSGAYIMKVNGEMKRFVVID